MPANPWDQSNILLSNRSGQMLGQGIASMASGLSQGISAAVQDHRQKKKEKEAEAGAIEYLKKNGAAMGLDSTDEGELKAAVKAAGGGMQAIQLIQGLEQMKMQKAAAAQQQQLQAAQLGEIEAMRSSRVRNAGAARLAAGGGGAPDAVVADYLRRTGDIKGSGDLSEGLARVATLNRRAAPPKMFDFNGRQAVQDASGNLQFLPEARRDPGAPIEIGGGKKAVVAGGTPFDYETGTPIQTSAPRRPNPPPFELKAMDPELYEAMRSDYLSSSPNAAPPGGGASAKLSESDQQALAWAKANPKDPRAAAIRKKLGL